MYLYSIFNLKMYVGLLALNIISNIDINRFKWQTRLKVAILEKITNFEKVDLLV